MGTIAQRVAAVIGTAATRPWAEVSPDLQRRIQGAIAADMPPACVAEPASEAALGDLMTLAHGENWRILPFGQGSKLSWGGPVAAVDVAISTARLNGIVEHAVGDLTVTVAAGTPLAAVQAQLATTGQFLALDPAYGDRATLGGIIATGDTGAFRQRYGGVRDQVIGVQWVRHDGAIAQAGGRVVKNVAGYDLMKLMTGAYGTLGILSQVTLRTYPQPETSETWVLSGAAAAIATVTAAVRRSPLTPVALDLLSPGLLAAVLEGNGGDTYGLAVRFQSIAAGVQEQGAALRTLAADLALQQHSVQGSAEEDFWHTLHRQFDSEETDARVRLKVGSLPAAAVDGLAYVEKQWGADGQGRIHASSGIGTVQVPAGRVTAAQVTALRSHYQTQGGYCIVLTGSPALKQAVDPWGLPPDTRRLMGALQAQFDPQQCLSPGRWGG
jgi:glycolate oxidase FAD binding subunit